MAPKTSSGRRRPTAHVATTAAAIVRSGLRMKAAGWTNFRSRPSVRPNRSATAGASSPQPTGKESVSPSAKGFAFSSGSALAATTEMLRVLYSNCWA
jgi:hypothetical protein